MMRQALTPIARPLLHTVHLLTFAILLVTGLLLFVPGLRAAVTGGYSQLIRHAHRWVGIAFVVLPVALVLACGPAKVFIAPARSTMRALWSGLHTGTVVIMWVTFTVTGFAIWDKRFLAESVVEGFRAAHDWLTDAAVVALAAHLTDIGLAGLLARFRAAASVQQSET